MFERTPELPLDPPLGCSAELLLFACNKIRFSCDVAGYGYQLHLSLVREMGLLVCLSYYLTVHSTLLVMSSAVINYMHLSAVSDISFLWLLSFVHMSLLFVLFV